MKPFYIFTGGPGSGKSSVLQALAQLGYTVVPEVGRAIIQQEVSHQGQALPWLNKSLFFERMFHQSLVDYRQQKTNELTFFDRGLLDSLGYAALENIPILPSHQAIAHETTYAPTVFIFPPWESIYCKDTERKQDFQLAVQTYDSMRSIYESYGYQLVQIPLTSIEKRVEFIVDYLQLHA